MTSAFTADIVGIADWVTANELKYMVWEENAPAALTANETTSTFAMLAAKSANHLAVIYGGTDDGKDMAIEAQFSEVDFNGLNTLLVSHGKVLTGSAGDALTSAQIAEIERKNGSYYQKLGVGGFVVGGKATSGQWIDVVYALDWMKGTMQVEVFNALTRSRRVPQTPAGLTVVEAAVRGVCEQAFRLGMIDGGLFTPTVTGIIRRATGDQGFSGETVKGYYIYIGSLAAQSQTDQEARKAPPISVWLKGQGAIQFARVDLLFEN